jgi:beta-N-acetylhexosaminidase
VQVSRAIFGISSTTLTAEEVNFFQTVRPYGYILFARNITDGPQLSALVKSIRDISPDYNAHVFIDQEGGRVARLKAPNFNSYPSMKTLVDGANSELEAFSSIEENFFKLGSELMHYGIDCDCAPVVDIVVDGAHDIIGDRSFGSDPIKRAGVDGVIKHIPGHGRALVDSHLDLPVVNEPLDVLEKTDFAAFKLLANSAPYAMTAHVVYTSLDPEQPATLSSTVIDYIRNVIGFKGLLMTDDLSMKALAGTMTELTIASYNAGCDLILHCNGNMDEMQEISGNLQHFEA